MNVETANRLQLLRKKNGFSQEELAEKIGISRQAVSKWERAEASPDTDNLIILAKLYGVTIDELIRTDSIPMPNNEGISLRKEDYIPEEPVNFGSAQKDDDGEIYPQRQRSANSEPQGAPGIVGFSDTNSINNSKNTYSSINFGLNDDSPIHENKASKRKSWDLSLLDKLFPLIIICLFFTSFSFNMLEISWLLFFFIPIYYTFRSAQRKLKSGEKTEPEAIIYFLNAALPILVTLFFLLSGFLSRFGSFWGKFAWTMYFILPIYYTAIPAYKKKNLLIFCYPAAAVWAYLVISMFFYEWVSTLFIIATIPFYYIIVDHFQKQDGFPDLKNCNIFKKKDN